MKPRIEFKDLIERIKPLLIQKAKQKIKAPNSGLFYAGITIKSIQDRIKVQF